MVLSELHKGDWAEIISVNADKALRDRLTSFGVIRGEKLFIKGCSLARQTMEIEVGATRIALRAEEASKIEVVQIRG